MAATNTQSKSLPNEQANKGLLPPADARLITALYHAYLGRSPDPGDIEVYQGLDQAMVSKLVADRAQTEREMRTQIEGSSIEGGAPDGVGGAAPTIPMGTQIIDYGREGWYFPQDTVLVQFQSGTEPTPGDPQTNYNTVWLYNKNNNKLVPFQNVESFNNFFKGQFDLNAAIAGKQINKLDSSVLVTPGNPFYKADTLKFTEGIEKSGAMPQATQLKWAYGQKIDNAKNDSSFAHITNFLELLKKDNTVGISTALIDSTLKDKNKMAEYQNAYGYGGYSINDVFKDLKSRQMSQDGYKDYDKVQAFDPVNRSEIFYNTPEAKRAYADSKLNMPETVAGVSSKALEDSAFFQKNSFFKAPFTQGQVDPNSAEFKASMEKIDAQMYDTAMKQIQAKTEREKAIADDNWRMVKESLEKRYQVSLSNNAFQAWSQLKQIFSNMSQRGLGASGVENEAVDATLAATRRGDENLRWSKEQEMEEQRRNYYVNSASPEQVEKDLTDEERTRWGLGPSADVAKYFDKANLKKMFPNLTDEELNQIRATAIDENGNYRTPNYQDLTDTLYKLGEEKKDFQFGQVLLQAVYGMEKDELANDPNNLSKYGSEYNAEADAQRGTFLSQKPGDEFYKDELTKGHHIPGINELKEIQADLKKKGIPESKWGEYVVKEADGKSLTYYPLGKNYKAPNSKIPPAATYVGPDGKRVKVDPSGKIPGAARSIPKGYVLEGSAPTAKNSVLKDIVSPSTATGTKAFTAVSPTGQRVAVDPSGAIKGSVISMPAGYKVEQLNKPTGQLSPEETKVKAGELIDKLKNTLTERYGDRAAGNNPQPILKTITLPNIDPKFGKTLPNTDPGFGKTLPKTDVLKQVVTGQPNQSPALQKPVVAATYVGPDGKRIAVDPSGKIKGSVTSIPTGYKLETTAPKLKSVFTR